MNLSQAKLLFGPKGVQLCDIIFSLQHRFPKIFPQQVISEGGFSFITKSLSDTHSVHFLCKFLFSWHRLMNRCLNLSSEKIHLKILEASPSVYGILIALKKNQDSQVLNQKLIKERIQNLVPGVRTTSDSYFSYQNDTASLFYLEIKKMKGGIFSAEDKRILTSKLPFELQQALESTPSLVLSENIEDLFKNIGRLSKEIKYTEDIPQTMISFIEYSPKMLSFLVIVIRVIKSDTPSIQTLSRRLPSFIQFSLEKIFDVGLVRKKYRKEAACFTLEVNSSIFMRNNEIDLRVARQYIGKALESMLGNYRDYTGGFLHLENEQLSAIKKVLEKEKFPFFHLFEGIFYSIKPITMRVLISVQTGVSLALLFKKSWSYQLRTNEKYHIESDENENAHMVVLKTTQKEWNFFLPSRVLKYSKQIAWSFLEYEETIYLFFFHQHPERPLLKEAILKELQGDCNISFNPSDSILRLNFQGKDPPSLNPRLATDIRCHILHNLLFEGLMRINSKGVLEPAAAEKIEVGARGLSYTFHLKTSHWSNGEEVTAYHFEKAWKRAILDRPALTRPDLFYPIKNVLKARQKLVPLSHVGIVAKDAKTLCVELESPCPYFLNALATPFFAPLLGDSEEPSQFNGPFLVAEWKHDHHIYLSQNPYYWNAKNVHLSGVKISMIRDARLFYQMFRDGNLDLIGDPISPLPPELLQLAEVQGNLFSFDIPRVFWIHCNTDVHPLHNASLRYALSLALDRQKLTDKVFLKQKPHASPLPPKYSSFKGSVRGNIKKARVYFRRALKELKIEASAFPPLVFTHSDLSFEKSLIHELKAQWKEALGITIIPVELPWNEFSAALDRGDFQLCGLFRRDIFNHVMSYLTFFKKTQYPSLGWENENFESYFHLFNEKKNLKKLEQILIKEAPVIPLVSQTYFYLSSQRFEGITWDNNGCLNLMEARIHEKISSSFNSPIPDFAVV